MKKMAIILDSFSGQTQESLGKNTNYYFLPLKIIADGKEYIDGVDLTQQKLLEIVNNANEIKTSQPSPAIIEELYKKLSVEYENVIYLALGSPLSGTFQTASIFANDYKNVYVINSRFVAKSFMDISRWIMNNQEMDIQKILKYVQDYSDTFETYIIPMNNDAFIRSGRLGRTVATLLNKAKVIPIIGYDKSDKLKKKMIKRSGAKAIRYAINKLEENALRKGYEFKWHISKTLNDELVQITLKQLKEKGYNDVVVELTSPLINTHVGDGAFSLGAIKIIDAK